MMVDCIALVMIVRNESRCIERCLSSAKPWVDRIIVVDTGSDDDTAIIAANLGAEVFYFAWNDDFSEARNVALEHSNCKWNLVLDADEWIETGGEHLGKLRSMTPDFVGRIKVRSSFEKDGRSYVAVDLLSRLLPGNVRYCGRIHEYPAHQLITKEIPLVIAHDGYSPQQKEQKGSRNISLLHAALKDSPDDPYLKFQLGKEYETCRDYAAALSCYLLCLKSCEKAEPWRHDLIVRTLYTLKMCKKYEDAIQLADSEMDFWAMSPDFFFVLGDIFLDYALSDPTQAEDILPMVEGAWQRCLEIGEQPQLAGTVEGRGSFLAANNLYGFYLSLNDEQKATYYKKVSETLSKKPEKMHKK